MQWFAGTSGYSYKAWRGSFYPQDIAADAMLAYYAERLPAVEINNTFYRMPSARVLAGWREATPPGFRFAIKAPRQLTHQAKLADAQDASNHLASTLAHLQDKLACVLFQLPPYLRKGAERLDAFLAGWPRELPAAVEFRHHSWFDDEIAAILHRHGAALAIGDDGNAAPPPSLRTADWLYLRLRRPDYDSVALSDWLAKGEATGAARAFAFFKHEDEGAGPRLATQFLKLAQTLSA